MVSSPARDAALIGAVETAVNHLLAMDAECRRDISRHAGRLIALDLANTGLTLYARITGEGVALSIRADGPADVSIRGTPLMLGGYFLALQRGGTAQAASIEITGDIGLAQDLQAAFRRLEPDFEERLSGWIGDTPAHKAGVAARRFIGLIRGAGRKLDADVGEYLRYEGELVMDRTELEEFNSSVDRLRDDVERLKARVDRLDRRGGG